MKIFILFLFLFLINYIFPINYPYQFQKKLSNDELLQRSIRGIEEDKNGLIWLGSYMGLTAFNGYDMRHYYNGTANNNLIGDNEIRTLYKDNDGNLWSGGFGNKINLYNYETDSFVIFKLDLVDTFIEDIVENNNNQLVIGTYNGIFLLHKETKEIKSLLPLKNFKINDLFTDNNFLYIASNKGLIKYNFENNKLKYIEKEEVNSIVLYKDYILYSKKDEVYAYKDSVSKKYNIEIHSFINCLYVDSKKNLWIGSDDGLYLYHNEKFYEYKNETHEGLVNNRIYDVFESSQNLLWIGTDYGYSFTNLEGENFETLLTNRVKPINAWGLANDSEDNLLIASRNNGLVKYNFEKDKLYTLLNVSSNTVISHEHMIFLGSKYNGVYILDNTGNIIKTINKENGLKTNEIRSLYFNRINTLYIGSELGLYQYNLDTEKLTEINKILLGSNRITAIIGDTKFPNKIWISVFGLGLVSYNIKTNLFSYYSYENNTSPKPWSLYDNGEELYLGDLSLGLFKFNKKESTLEKVPIEPLGNSILAMGMDKYNRLWLSGNGVLGYYKNHKYVAYKSLDGIQEGEFNPGSVYLDTDGHLYFGGDLGITRINHNFIQKFEKEQTISFTSLTYLSNNEYVDLLNKTKINIANDNRSFILKFSNLNYLANSSKNYAIKVNNNPWISLKNQRELTYIGIPKGEYTFRVKYFTKDGNLSKNEDILYINVSPKFYETNIAKLFYFITLVLIFYFLNIFYKSTKRFSLQEEISLLNMLLLKDETINSQMREFLLLINKLFFSKSIFIYLYNKKTKKSKIFSLKNNNFTEKESTWNGENNLKVKGFNSIFTNNDNFNSYLFINSDKRINKFSMFKLKSFFEQANINFEKTLKYEEEIEKIYIDPLTKLYNRKYSDILLPTLEKEQKDYSIMIVDIDYFKSINDNFGHPIGDVVLEHLAKSLKSYRNIEAIRFGGEEFLLIYQGANHKSAIELAEQIRRDIERNIIKIGTLELGITVSIGLALGSPYISSKELIEKAHSGLYLAKNSGRNHVKIKI